MKSILEQKISKLTGREASITTHGTRILLSLGDLGHLFILENNLVKNSSLRYFQHRRSRAKDQACKSDPVSYYF